MTHYGSVSRRSFLRMSGVTGAAALAAACAPAAAPPAQPAATGGGAPAPAGKAAWEQEWETLVAAAKKEGRVDLNWILGGAGGYQKCVDDFNKAFPGVEAQLTTMASGSLMVPKVIQEHQAGIYSFDLLFTQNQHGDLMKGPGALQPIKPHVFHADALDDKKWSGGFASGWVDKDKSYGYGFAMNAPKVWWMNTDLVREGEIKSANDLLNPKWQGKMILADVRSGYTSQNSTAMRLNLGDDFLKKLLVDQNPTFSRDNRLITEAMVKGQYALATGVPVQILEEFQTQGLGKNLKAFTMPEAATMSMGHQVWATKGAPHPNAMKLFLNWLLTKEGQTAYVNSTRENSRRSDAPPGDPTTRVEPGQKYLWLGGNDAMAPEIEKTIEMGIRLTTR